MILMATMLTWQFLILENEFSKDSTRKVALRMQVHKKFINA